MDLFGFGGIDGQRIMAIFVLTKAAHLKSTLVSGVNQFTCGIQRFFKDPWARYGRVGDVPSICPLSG
jgi:hypothetical protein